MRLERRAEEAAAASTLQRIALGFLGRRREKKRRRGRGETGRGVGEGARFEK